MYVFCVGMYRSCSTWQYNVACRLLERHRDARRLGPLTEEAFQEIDRRGHDTSSWLVLKCHDSNPSFAAALAEGRALALYSFRDLRDVCYSLMHKFGQTFEQVTEPRGLLRGCVAGDAFWTAQTRTLCQQYERLMEQPLAGVREIAAHLGVEPAEGEAESLVDEFSLPANRQRAAHFADRLRQEGHDLSDPANALLWDPDSLLHWNHIRTGEAGSWRRLSDSSQLATLALACGPWLIERGYETDFSWARAGLDYLENVLHNGVPAFQRHVLLSREIRQEQAASLESARRTMEELEARLSSYADLGPDALGVARAAKHFSLRFPRLARWAKRVMGRTA